ncbi:MAG TPA: DUF2335 domain-containing protein [Candidatus Rifleibacterium sp.]|nr:DUF2335 domain-containing protein [Candidatus Rifleibacterium sp.]HPW57657.1 DUF2335 domain-containing protein [Candidatus Rifleibacterium sp.]HQB84162.1 DUF2335 domain-containing protein [Candidatus Rifleibacterium sp.]
MNKARAFARAKRREMSKNQNNHPPPAPPKPPAPPQQGYVLSQTHVGPIPHPAILQKYDEIHPGAAAIIFNMAQKEQEHRITSETKELEIIDKAAKDKAEITRSGQLKSSLVGGLMLLVISYLGYCRLENAAIVLSVAFLGGALTTIVTGKSEGNATLAAITQKFIGSKKKKKKKPTKKAGD